MNWMTYPLTSVIDMIWKEHLPELQSGKTPNPYHVEFIAILECTLNYAHTGSAKVLSKAVMQPHYLALSAIHDSLPCLNPYGKSHMQVSAPESLRAQQQSEVRFVIFNAVAHPDMYMLNDNRVEKKNLSSNKLYQHVFEVAFKIYIEDIKEFIRNAVQKELEPLSRSRDFVVKQSAREHRVLLKTWMGARYPLGYEVHEIAQLIAVLALWQCNDPAEPRNHEDMAPLAFPAPPGGGWSWSQHFQTLHIPFIQHGMFKYTVSEAMELVGDLIHTQRPLWTHDLDEARDIMKAIMVKAVQELKINHIPWVTVGDGPAHEEDLPLTSLTPSGCHWGGRAQEIGHDEARLLESCDKIALCDAQTIWSATRQCPNYHNVLHNQCLPSEWAYKNTSIQAKDTLSKEVYTWLPEAYDPINKPLHALAMVISFVFSGMLPMCFPPTDFSTEEKGATIAPPFITMVMTFIIAVMDPELPFHRCKDPSLKKIFMSKHMSKGINVMNILLRFRLAQPLTTKILKGSQWCHDIAPISDDEI
ncbi:hypothetical protein JVT61DRAFT_4605 [Boletus reticuloceps]|uniref:Uncharacterized protein n=1 Tax=Boletus reticuloceps TaxID=495285 RepID=A0A8I2YLI0_9AGAM|nr:hypothetical protein JVT61DRAFT_4605 [Boletus reticuloceps]